MTLDPIDFARRNITFFTDKEAPEEKNFGRINYVMRQNGLWEVRKNSIATFYVHLCSQELLGFPKEEEPWFEGFVLHVPKIPKVLLDQTIAFFKSICDKIKAEAYVQYIFNTETKEYKISCPKQEVSGARVSYEPTPLGPNELLVCEIHSHNTMDAFFSPVDNEDEKSRGDRFFGVIGQLNKLSPAMKMSFYSGGRQRVETNISDVFDVPPSVDFPTEWIGQVVEKKYTVKDYKPKHYSKDSGVMYERTIGGADFDIEGYHTKQQQNLDLMLAEEYDADDEDEKEEGFDPMYYARGRPKKTKPKPKAQSRVKTMLREKGAKV